MRRLFQMATIRGRLIAGFGTSITLLVAAGVLGWYWLSRSNAQAEATVHDLTDRSEFVERATNIALRELVAGLRFLSTGTPADEAQYQALTVQAEQLRRDAVATSVLSAEERRRLETIGRLQATLEVRIATTRAWQIAGQSTEANRVLALTTRDIQAIESELQGLRRAARDGAGEAIDRMHDWLRNAEASLVVVVTLAFGVAAFFGLSTARAITQPMVQLRDELMAIGAGDLRDPPFSANSLYVAQEYAELIDAMRQARERLRLLFSRVQEEADQVTLAASELTASASSAAASSQHVTSAIMDISHGATMQLTSLNHAGETVKELAEAGATIGEAADETDRVGREIRHTTNGARDQVQVAIDTLLGAREVVQASREEMVALRDATGVIDDFVSVISEIATKRICWRSRHRSGPCRHGGARLRGGRTGSGRWPNRRTRPTKSRNVKRFRSRIASASTAVESGATRLRDAETVAEAVRGALARIEHAVAQVEGATARVTTAVEGNRRSLSQVQRSLYDARDTAEGHAAAAEEVAASTEQTSASAQEVSATAEMLQTASLRVRGLIGEFRT